MRKVLAGVLLLLGVVGLGLGWLGETLWAPDESHTASVNLSEPGAAMVVDPGVLYVGGEEGTVTVKGDGAMTLIAANPNDVKAYLDGVPHTAITGVPNWNTLKTEKRNSDGDQSLTDPAKSDLWLSSSAGDKTVKLDIAKWASEELNPKSPRPYRTVMIVADGTKPAANKVSIEWPSNDTNGWVPYAYAAGAVFAVVGLVLLFLTFTAKNNRDDSEDHDELGSDPSAVADDDYEPVELADPREPETEDNHTPRPIHGKRRRSAPLRDDAVTDTQESME